MKNTLRHWAIAAIGAAAAIAFTSCAYDPYYSSSSVGGSYSSGYGDGYGYGSSNFSTSVFVSTGNARWGYDPYCYSYYDYSRRCYYDPYLHGYYPVGYRPPIVYGCPHPSGYRRGYCPPPSYVRYNTVSNYRNREYAYRNSSYGWAKQVRQQPAGKGRVQDEHPSRQTQSSRYSSSQKNSGRQDNAVRPSNGNQGRQSGYPQGGVKPGIRETQGGRLPAGYNTPVTRTSQNKYNQGGSNSRVQSKQPSYQKNGGGNGGGRKAEQAPQRGGKNQGNGGRQEEKRGMRGLGQG